MSDHGAVDGDGDVRRTELATALASVRAEIAAACEGVGRDPSAVTLVAVTKTYPASDVVRLADLGVLDVGESRDQEAVAKVVEVEQLRTGGRTPRWHFVGRLQSRKARSVASYAHSVHSVDRAELADGLADGVVRAGRDRLDVFVQVSLDGDPDRGGVAPEQIVALADRIATRSELDLRGVMAVAPLGADPDAAFAHLAQISSDLTRAHPTATAISAGMSADLAAALRHGATHVRVGSALLGRRSPLFG